MTTPINLRQIPNLWVIRARTDGVYRAADWLDMWTQAGVCTPEQRAWATRLAAGMRRAAPNLAKETHHA